jgi:hypothetical protein
MSEQMKITSTNKGGPATTLIPGDQIAVNLVATKPDGSRMSAGGLFNHMGEPVDVDGKVQIGQAGLHIETLGGAAMPEFPAVKYQELLDSGQQEAAEDLKTAYELDLAKWQDEGNLSLPDGIANMVLDWAARVHNVHTTDGDHPVIKPDQVVVKNVIREKADQPGVFTVQLTPSWG